MTLGFPGPFDAMKAASCDSAPDQPRDGARRHHRRAASAGLIGRAACAGDRRQCGRRGGRGRARRDRRHARSLWYRGRSLCHRRPPGCLRCVSNGRSPCLPWQRHRSTRRLARVHARAWPGCARRPPRDGPAMDRSPRPSPGSSMGASRSWNDSAPGRSPSWPRRPSATPRTGSRFRRPKRTSIVSQRRAVSASYPTSAAVFLPDGARAASRRRSCASPISRARSRSSPAGVPTSSIAGEIAKAIASFLAANGGALTEDDFADHATDVSPPLTTSYRGHTVYETGLPTPGIRRPRSAQYLRAGAAWRRWVSRSAQAVHTEVSALRLAFADRRAYAGDPNYVDTPLATLLSKEWAAERYATIDSRYAATIDAGVIAGGRHHLALRHRRGRADDLAHLHRLRELRLRRSSPETPASCSPIAPGTASSWKRVTRTSTRPASGRCTPSTAT